MRLAFCLALLLGGCSGREPKEVPKAKETPPAFFHVDPSTAGTLTGTVKFFGTKPMRKAVDMSGEPACIEAHHVNAYDEPVVVNPNGALANVFVYIKTGLEGKLFEVPANSVAIDQRGCWFHPRVLGIQTGQKLDVINSDPVTHNIHPLAQINRECNHSQGSGDAPLARKFLKPETMIKVKCNIHSWMRAYIGVLDHPYYAVTAEDGIFAIPKLPPGNYTLVAWQETLGEQEQKVTVGPAGMVEANFRFKGE